MTSANFDNDHHDDFPGTTTTTTPWVTLTESVRAPAYVELRIHDPTTIANFLQYAFSRDFRKKGMINLSTYLRQYRLVATMTNYGENEGLTEGQCR